MAEVQPIRGRKQIKDIGNYLKGKDEKYYIMFLIGVQSGLRVSDVLNLRVSDIDSMSSRKIKEKKTNKKRFLYLNDRTEKEIRRYIVSHELEPDDYLVYSRKHFHGHEVGGTNPSLIEALGSTELNLLLKVGFNQEVALESALYWTKESGSLARLIDKADAMKPEDRLALGVKAKERVRTAYSWQFICDRYAEEFLRQEK